MDGHATILKEFKNLEWVIIFLSTYGLKPKYLKADQFLTPEMNMERVERAVSLSIV